MLGFFVQLNWNLPDAEGGHGWVCWVFMILTMDLSWATWAPFARSPFSLGQSVNGAMRELWAGPRSQEPRSSAGSEVANTLHGFMQRIPFPRVSVSLYPENEKFESENF